MAAEERTYKTLADALPKAGAVCRLNLSKQNLSEVPSEISKLKNLYHLNLSGNQLQELPRHLFTLKKLEEVLLQNNQIAHLPEAINALTHLRELYLGDNRLKILPDMSKLKNLEILILRGNPLPKAEINRIKRMLPATILSI